tara:strand:+ start:76 stop:444 length:369 start_codon:yes stop_codon:yes gene_type:complete
VSFQAMSWAIKQSAESTTSKLILLILANYADSENSCYPSHDHIAFHAHCTRRTVITNIKNLEKKGLVKVVRTKDGLKKLNRYYLRCEKFAHNTNINKGEKITQRKSSDIFKKKTKNKNFIAM